MRKYAVLLPAGAAGDDTWIRAQIATHAAHEGYRVAPDAEVITHLATEDGMTRLIAEAEASEL